MPVIISTRLAGMIQAENHDRVPMKYALTTLTVVLICGISACTPVRFNERERLSQPDMAFDSTPLKSEIEADVYSAREGASGVFTGGGGGGCGCY